MKYRYIKSLTAEEKYSLEYGYKNGKKHYFRIKCKSILMSNEGDHISQIAAFAKKTPRTIRNWFNDFEKNGIVKLVIGKGRGIKAPLDALNEDQIKEIKTEIGKNYQNIKSVCTILSGKFGFKITKWMLIRFIKKNSIILGTESVNT